MKVYRGDLEPPLVADLYDEDPDTGTRTPLDVTGAASIRILGQVDGEEELRFDRAPTTVDGATVTLEWEDGDTDQVGEVTVEIEVTWPGGRPQTFRVADPVWILADLG